MEPVVHINANLNWQSVRGKGGNWVAVCEPLKITLQAETWAELMEDIASSINLLMRDLVESNEFDQFMKDRGWTVSGQIPQGLAAQQVRFDVPFFLSMKSPHD